VIHGLSSSKPDTVIGVLHKLNSHEIIHIFLVMLHLLCEEHTYST